MLSVILLIDGVSLLFSPPPGQHWLWYGTKAGGITEGH